MRVRRFCLFFVFAAILPLGLPALEVKEGYEASILPYNCGGGFDYLPDGDIIGLFSDLAFSAPGRIVRVDANGDGLPSSPETLYEFDTAVAGAFVKVSPGGEYALFSAAPLGGTGYTIYRMELPAYTTRALTTVDGVFDLAFCAPETCYYSANSAWGITNKIYRWNIASGETTEIISVSPTHSGPVDVDDAGNLYYIRNRAHYPVEPGDYTLLRFTAETLSRARAAGDILDETDAGIIAATLDGGYDVAWHASGTCFVSDANNGTVSRVETDGKVTPFISHSAGALNSYTTLAFHRRGGAFGPGMMSSTLLGVIYSDWSTTSTIHQTTSCAPAFGAATNNISYQPGDRFILEIAIRNAVPVVFDGYLLFIAPDNSTYSLTGDGTIVRGRHAYATSISGLREGFTGTLLNASVPEDAAQGEWRIITGLVPAGAQPVRGNAMEMEVITVKIGG